MNISELQELLELARERHGDLEVYFTNRTPFFGTSIMSIEKAYIRRDSKAEIIKIDDEPLSNSKPPVLIFDNTSEDEGEEDHE